MLSRPKPSPASLESNPRPSSRTRSRHSSACSSTTSTRGRTGVLDGVGDRLAADVHKRVERRLVGLAPAGTPPASKLSGVFLAAARTLSRTATTTGLRSWSRRPPTRLRAPASARSPAATTALARGARGWIVRERPRIGEREREILHDEVVDVGGQPLPLAGQRVRREGRVPAIASAAPETVQSRAQRETATGPLSRGTGEARLPELHRSRRGSTVQLVPARGDLPLHCLPSVVVKAMSAPLVRGRPKSVVD